MTQIKADIDYNQLERLAAQGLTQKAAAKELGIKESSFTHRVNNEPAFRRAWRKGLEKPKSAQRLGESAARVLVEIRARRIVCRADIREATGFDYPSINNALHELVCAGLVGEVDCERTFREFYRLAGSGEKPPVR